MTTISNLSELQAWLANPSTNAILTQDITISSNFSTLSPITDKYFDGGGKILTISNVSPYNGTFNLQGGTIKNLAVVVNSSSPATSPQCGFVLSSNCGGTLNTVTLTVNNSFLGAGGFAGIVNSGTLFQNCTFYGHLANNSHGFVYSADIVGEGEIQFVNCAATITNWNNSANSAGFVGSGYSTIVIQKCVCVTTDNGRSGCVAFVYGVLSASLTIQSSYFVCNNPSKAFDGTVFANYIDSGNITIDGCYYYDNGTSINALNFGPTTGGFVSGIITFDNNIYSSSNQNTSEIQNLGTITINNPENLNFGHGFGTPIPTGNLGAASTTYPWTYGSNTPLLTYDNNFLDTPWDGNYNNVLNAPTINMTLVCFLEGTLIKIFENNQIIEKKIELLRRGDFVVTLNGNKPIIKIVKSEIIATSENCPYLVSKNSYGKDIPHTDLYLSPWHALYINNKFKHMNCSSGHKPCFEMVGTKIKYYHLCLDTYPEVIYSNGITSESCGLLHRPYVKNFCNKEECKILVSRS